MSVLVHLCRGCSHQTAWHEAGNGGYSSCRCCRAGSADPDPTPTVLPTYTSPHGIREPLWEPGTQRNVGTMHASRTCDCGACRAAFRAGRAAPRGAPGVSARNPRSDPERAAG